MDFKTLYSCKLSANKEIRILEHDSNLLFFDIRRVTNGRYSKNGIFLAADEALQFFDLLDCELRHNSLKEFTLTNTGRIVVMRRDAQGVGIWSNRANPFSKYAGLYFLCSEFEDLKLNIPKICSELLNHE